MKKKALTTAEKLVNMLDALASIPEAAQPEAEKVIPATSEHPAVYRTPDGTLVAGKKYDELASDPMKTHKWTGQRRGGAPADAGSCEWVRYCEVCGMEDSCEDPLPPCPGPDPESDEELTQEQMAAAAPDPVEERPDGWYWVTYKGIVQTSPFEWEGACWAVCGGTLSQEESADVEVLCPVPSAADWEATRRELASAQKVLEALDPETLKTGASMVRSYATYTYSDPRGAQKIAETLDGLATRLREWRTR